MDLVTIPQTLLIFYGALILSCGGALGVIAGRHWKGRSTPSNPKPPELLNARVALLEQELDATNAELGRLRDERDFMRELRPPSNRVAAA